MGPKVDTIDVIMEEEEKKISDIEDENNTNEQEKLANQIAENVLEDNDENKQASNLIENPPLKDFKIRELFQIIEDFINNEEHDIEKILIRIKDFCKGTKAEPFLNKLSEYLVSKFSPSQAIFKIMKKFGPLLGLNMCKERSSDRNQNNSDNTSSQYSAGPPNTHSLYEEDFHFGHSQIEGERSSQQNLNEQIMNLSRHFCPNNMIPPIMRGFPPNFGANFQSFPPSQFNQNMHEPYAVSRSDTNENEKINSESSRCFNREFKRLNRLEKATKNLL